MAVFLQFRKIMFAIKIKTTVPIRIITVGLKIIEGVVSLRFEEYRDRTGKKAKRNGWTTQLTNRDETPLIFSKILLHILSITSRYYNPL